MCIAIPQVRQAGGLHFRKRKRDFEDHLVYHYGISGICLSVGNSVPRSACNSPTSLGPGWMLALKCVDLQRATNEAGDKAATCCSSLRLHFLSAKRKYRTTAIRTTPRGTPMAAMIIVDLEWVFVVVAVDNIVWELAAVEDVARVAFEASGVRRAVVGTLKELDSDVSVVGTLKGVDDVSVVGTWDDEISEEGLLKTLEAVASTVRLTTRITPKPAVRI